ncbi:MAG TPA: heme peroxidase family protein [Solirubrobacteraceae bacterium]|nr:heme peroxidase family protein [Solirubrobacteraceae bacterium]
MEAHGRVTEAATEQPPEMAENGAPEPDVIDQEQASRGHGSESFFILGEGLVSASRGGREPSPAPPTVTATAAAQAPAFRFSRSGPKGGRISRPARRKIAKAMTDAGGTDSTIPAGYTYLGQFVDHDMTFDRTKVALGEDVSPSELRQGRSPGLDLDSLYGAGPDDPASEKFYESDGRRLKMGRTQGLGGPPFQARDGFDLPRHPDRKLATIPDFRNDENLIVAQTHLAFIRFHNRVVAELADVPAAQRFTRARRQVVKHYQWMIRHDYLPRICDPAVVDDVFANGRKFFEADVDPTETPTMPVEFSVAAFRLGHSMIRSRYSWNLAFDNGQGTLPLLFDFSGTSGFLGKGSRLPSNWIADWRRMYSFAQNALKVPAAKSNLAKRIDTRLVDPLGQLPPGSFGLKQPPQDPLVANLAFRNLERAAMMRLATGQGMVQKLQNKGVAVAALTDAQIRDGSGGASIAELTNAEEATFLDRTPLWFYILREAELGGGRLAGVGARIVAETFHRAIEGSRISILRDTDFKPRFGPDDATFDMRDLLFFAFEGKKELLAPLGD